MSGFRGLRDSSSVHAIVETFGYDDMTDGGGVAGTYALSQQIPDGAVFLQATCHSLTGFTNDTSATVQIGDGSDVDRYSTGTPNVFVTNVSGVYLGAPSGATPWHDAAATVTVTITTAADFTSVNAGQITVQLYYYGILA